ncbi:MAG: energy-coupling factor ABC transporter ATP-binding protein [Verrucomicrobiae bacterium]|nr:energy-coupling factor ABC transporter ATP-binding protein [Verrucomicrobiae bacterium]MDW8342888.1 ABC transporter ATP-binding protein [Verrucomicrobiae bacterium]
MTPAIEVCHLSYRYPDGREALRDVSFTVAEGECVGLVGPNGAGKSTLLQHLNGILPEHPEKQSAVRIFGETDVEFRRRAVGFLFQDPDDQLFCPTVWEDVAFGPKQLGLGDDVVREALACMGLTGFETRAPHHLSHGEKRRVCLAGVLACRPRILVLDEPTSDLDPRGRRELKAYLRKIPVTKLIATHDLEMVVELCPRVILLDAGRVVCDGLTLEILNDEPLMLAHGLERPHILLHRHPHGPARPHELAAGVNSASHRQV